MPSKLMPLTKSGKKIIPSQPPSQSNYLGGGAAPTIAKPSKKPFGKRMSAADPSMDELADRTHPTRRA